MVNTSLQWDGSYDEGRKSKLRLNRIVKHMSTPGTVLDLGANAGFFSHGLAKKGFDVVAVEPPNEKSYDLDLVMEHRAWVQTPDDLPSVEFDYALALSVLHHIPGWKDLLDHLLSTTKRAVFVEVPSTEEQHHLWHGSRASYDYLTELPNAKVIGSYPEVSGRLKRDLWVVDLT